MKTINYITIALIISLFTFTSCNEKDDNLPVNTHEDAYVDVILKKVNTPDGIRYVEIFFAGGVDIAATGSMVTAPDGTTYDLAEFWAGPGKLTKVGAMTMTKPVGNYTFLLKFDDASQKSLTDVIEDVEINLPMPFSVDYTVGDDHMIVSWTEVPNADLICIKITEIDMTGTKPIFKKAQLPAGSTSLTINFDGAEGWMRPVDQLVSGTQYWVAVAAKKVEAGTEVSGISQDFQTSSCVRTKITF
jgi:hypothetical protein